MSTVPSVLFCPRASLPCRDLNRLAIFPRNLGTVWAFERTLGWAETGYTYRGQLSAANHLHDHHHHQTLPASTYIITTSTRSALVAFTLFLQATSEPGSY